MYSECALLSCHPSCPDAPRCPRVAIQLFISLFPPPQPVGMCRLNDSREIQRGGGGWLVDSSIAPSTLCFSLGSSASRSDSKHRTVFASVPGSEAAPLRSQFWSDRGPGLERVTGSGRGRDGASLHTQSAHFNEPTEASKRVLLSTCSLTFSQPLHGAFYDIINLNRDELFLPFFFFFTSRLWLNRTYVKVIIKQSED